MKSVFLYLIITLAVSSCGSTSHKTAIISSNDNEEEVQINQQEKEVETKVENEQKEEHIDPFGRNPKNKKIKKIVSYAKSFEGTKYKYGGTTKKGMDCSGLVYTAFQIEDIELPRSSKTMATKGTGVKLKKVAIGDLLFFKTNKRKNVISHVGLVVSTRGTIKFIHSSTSKGVVVSSMEEEYWDKAFTLAKRML